MSKIRVIIDFDNTIVDSAKNVFELYKKKYNIKNQSYHTNFLWDFEGLIPEQYKKECIELFSKQEFYDSLKIEKETLEVLEWINENFEMIICTKHKAEGILMKSKWIEENIPFAKKVVFLVQEDFDKDCVGTKEDIIIDDKVECMTADRRLKLLFGDYKYNQLDNIDTELRQNIMLGKSTILRVNKWKDIKKILQLLL